MMTVSGLRHRRLSGIAMLGGATMVTLAVAAWSPAVRAADTDTLASPIQDPRAGASFAASASARQSASPMALWERRATRAQSAGELASLTAGAAGSAAGGRAAANADSVARREFAAAWSRNDTADLAGESGNFGTVGVYDQYFWDRYVPSLQTAYPGRAVGKLYFNTPSGGSSCTASVFSPNNVAVTAAHCCHSRSAWYSGWVFAPSLRGTALPPYGTFSASRATILTGWITLGSRFYDVCVLNLRNNSVGRPVTFYTGWLGRSWNQPVVGHDHSWGYPGNFGGSIYRGICSAETYASPAGSCGGTSTQNMGCAMTYGASGGPWMRGFKLGQISGYVNSVVSGFDGAACGTPFGQSYNGPYFSTGNIVPLCTAAGC